MTRYQPAVLRCLQAACALLLALSMWMPRAGSRLPLASALSNTVVISQVYGSGGNSGAVYNSDYVELFNHGDSPISLTGWSIQYASATGTGFFSGQITALNGTLNAGQYYLIKLKTGATGVVLPTPDATGTFDMSGTSGKVALVNTATGLACNGVSTPCSPAQLAQIVDLVGYGTANYFEGSAPAPAISSTTAAFRQANGCTETDNNGYDFQTAAPAPRNTTSPAHLCPLDDAPVVFQMDPAQGAFGVAVDSAATLRFTEPVSITANSGDIWFTCDITGSHTAAVTSSPDNLSLTFNPDIDFARAETCTLTIPASKVSDLDTIDPPDQLLQDFTLTFTTVSACGDAYKSIGAIQSSGTTSPLVTSPVSTQGIVVGDYEGASPALRGFYLEDPSGDGDPATSDGIFIFESSNANNVALGDNVRVMGTVEEYQGQTQINAAVISLCGTGKTVAAVEVSLPIPDGDYLERYEGMLVHFAQRLYVTETYQLGRFDEVLLSSGGRLVQPTNQVAPGSAANALQAQNLLNQILLDDASQAQNPDPILFGRGENTLSAANTLRGGDYAEGITGVMTYTWGGASASPNAYRVRPVNALGGSVPDFKPGNPRPDAPANPGGSLRVVSMNLLNYFNTFTGCTNGVGGAATDCRGAENSNEFERQSSKTVAAIIATGGDVIGVTEMENDGYGSGSAIQELVNRLNAATAVGTYAFIDADAGTSQVNALGSDAIKVGLLYKPEKVTPVGTTASLNSSEFVNGGDDAPRNRAALAQAFEENASGKAFVVSVNHFKSKGSACNTPDTGDGQGNCAAVRTQAAQRLTAWLASNPTGIASPRTLILGDLNSYALEDPITTLQEAGYASLADKYLGNAGYSYVFDGQWGSLDYVLADVAMIQKVTGIVEYHINADEPAVLDYNTNFKSTAQLTSLYSADAYRAADHDPLIVGLNLSANRAPQAVMVFPNQKVFAGTPFNFSLPAGLFHDPDLDDHLTLSATLADGSPLPSWLTFDPLTSTFTGLPENQSVGSLVIKVTATDTSLASASTTFTLAAWTQLMLPLVLTL